MSEAIAGSRDLLRERVELVERDREREILRAHVDRLAAGRGGIVLISGEAGIGKTALVGDALDFAAPLGAVVLSGACYDLTITPPYGPWREVSRGYAPSGDMPEIPTELLPGTPLTSIHSQVALFEVATEFLTRVARACPLVVVLEDLHWSDGASIEMLRHVARFAADGGYLLLATYRDDDLPDDHPLLRHVVAIVRESGAQLIELHRLSTTSLARLVAQRFRLRTDDSARLTHWLHRRSEGNPFYALELLRSLVSASVLVRADVDDGWALGALEDVRLPSLLRQAINERLNRLSPAARAHLQVAAVIGTVVPLDLWCAACDAELDELNNSWIEARAAQIVVERASGTGFEFRHALLREALYASIPVPRRQGLHQRLAEALSARRTPDPDAMSYHLQQAGDDAFVRWLVRAGGRAERSYAWREAFDRFSTAAAELDDRPDRRLERGWLLFRLGAMLRFSDVRRALRYFEQATDVADVLGDQVLWAFATYARGSQRVQTGDFRGGLPILERGIRALIAMPLHDRRRLNATTGVFNADAMPDFDTLSAHGRRDDPEPADPGLVFPGDLDRQGVLALMLARVGDARRALAVTDEAIAQLATGEPSRTFHIGHLQRARGLALALLGLPDESIHWLQESIRTFDSGPAYMQQLDSIATTLRALVLPYRLEDARLWFELTSNAHQIGALAQDAFPKGLSYHHLLLAVYLADGEWDKADELVQSAQLATGQVVMRHGIQTAGAELALARGNTQAAWGYVRSVLEGGPTTEPGDSMYLASMRLIRVAVELSLADGHLADARAWLECHDRWLEWSGAVPGRAEGQLAWAAWQRAAGDAGAERACIERAVILASAPRQPLELLHAHLALGEWHLRARDPSEAARQLDSAADLAERCDMPVERHHIRLVRAEVALAEGRLDDAQRLLDDVRPFCERLQVAALLRRAADLEQSIAARRTRRLYPANLSEREVEVLRLVAGGMTDAEVADTLSISPRTVGQHLRSIYNKLGVSSRVAAARFAIAHDLV